MKTTFIALQLDPGKITQHEIANLFNVADEAVTVDWINHSVLTQHWKYGGTFRNFRRLTDIYVWTSKYWYGLYEEKLAFVRIIGVDKLSTFFAMKYLDVTRFAVATERVSIFDKTIQKSLDDVWKISLNDFDQKRIKAILPHLPKLTPYFNLLYHYNNPF